MQNTDLNLGFGLQARKPNAKQSIFLGKPISTELFWKAGFKLLLHKIRKNQENQKTELTTQSTLGNQ